MPNIKLLNQDLINKIAAGEVVERPASVVKELVENSIDAEAENITIEIENGGLNLIKVVDDGCGMTREDAELSIQQHATSKINSVDDLYDIQSLGFRGEALASISSVSSFELITKNPESVAGTQVLVQNGKVQVSEIGSPNGTCVKVAELFYNVPVRQKYLKTAVTEFNHIVDLFLRYALTFPELNWKLVHNNKPVYQFSKTDLESRIHDVLGEEISTNLIKVDCVLNELQINGYIGKPQIARNNHKLQYLSINKRPVNEYIVAKQVKDAFTTLMPREMHPVFIFNIDINNEKVDVNVHPRKLEVRFSDPQVIYRTVYRVISRTLDEVDLIKKIKAEPETENINQINDLLQQKKVDLNFSSNKRSFSAEKYNFTKPVKASATEFNKAILESVPHDISERITDQPKEYNDELYQEKDIRILGQVENSYIIVVDDNGIKIYDQHASSERVQYEKIKQQWEIGKLASQKLLLPQNIQLTVIESRAISDNIEFLERLGFEINELSANTFSVSAVPRLLVDSEIKEIILELVGEMTESIIINDKISEPINRIFNMMACRSAIKFGDVLTEEGMTALINDLEKLNNKYTCVHGRPCVLEFSFSELKKMFKRT